MLIGKGEVEMDPEKIERPWEVSIWRAILIFQKREKPMGSQSWPDALAMTPKAGVGMP